MRPHASPTRPFSSMLPPGEATRREARASTALAALLACLVLLPLLGHKPLAAWDEGIYAEVAREMPSSGWLVPHWNGQVWLEKPPLALWITALLFKAFGVTEFWARVGSAFAGVATVALLHGWLARRRDRLAAWLCTLMLLATFGFLHVCRVGETDVLLSLGCCVALVGLAEADRGDGGSRAWILFWIGLAIAVMTKGTAAIVLLLTAPIYAGLQRWRASRFGRHFWLGGLLFLALTLPWHLAMLRLFGTSFVAEYFGLHTLARATQQIEGHTTRWWFYGKVLLVSAPPFVLLYPVAVARALRRPQLRVWAVFVLVVLLFFTLVQTRLPHYIAPAYPALSLVTGAWLADRLRLWLSLRRPAVFWIRAGLAAAVVSVAAVLFTTPGRRSLHTAKLADGTVLPDDKDSIALLRRTFGRPQPISGPPLAPGPQAISGPLLLWRREPVLSIAPEVFYSRREVQQVELSPSSPNRPTDIYTYQPEPLDQAVTSNPRLILLDKSLIAEIPSRLHYTTIQSGDAVELGSIRRDP